MTKICKVCRLEQPNHKMSCRDSNKKYVIPTAGEVALKNDYDHEEAMKEFTNLHLDNAIKEHSEYLFKCSIDKEYPLTYIDWLKDYKTKNKLI